MALRRPCCAATSFPHVCECFRGRKEGRGTPNYTPKVRDILILGTPKQGTPSVGSPQIEAGGRRKSELCWPCWPCSSSILSTWDWGLCQAGENKGRLL